MQYTQLKKFIIRKFDYEIPDTEAEEEDDEDAPVIVEM